MLLRCPILLLVLAAASDCRLIPAVHYSYCGAPRPHLLSLPTAYNIRSQPATIGDCLALPTPTVGGLQLPVATSGTAYLARRVIVMLERYLIRRPPPSLTPCHVQPTAGRLLSAWRRPPSAAIVQCHGRIDVLFVVLADQSAQCQDLCWFLWRTVAMSESSKHVMGCC